MRELVIVISIMIFLGVCVDLLSRIPTRTKCSLCGKKTPFLYSFRNRFSVTKKLCNKCKRTHVVLNYTLNEMGSDLGFMPFYYKDK